MAYNLRFELRRDVTNKKGESPVALIIVVEAQRRKLPTGITILPQLWNAKDQKAIYQNPLKLKKALPGIDADLLPLKDDINSINSSLQELKKTVEREITRFKMNNVTFSAEMLIVAVKENTIPGTKQEGKKLLFVSFIADRIPALSIKRSPGTLQVYNSSLKHFKEFEQYQRRKYEIKEINYSVLEALDAYLLRDQVKEDGSVTQMQNGTIHKIIKTLKTFLNHAAHIGLETASNYRKYQIELKRNEPITLTFSELDTLFKMELTPMATKVRDVFVFACATGLRVSDLKYFGREHIIGAAISLTAQKTDEPVTIPINYYSGAILEKYRLHIKPIPQLSEQHLNSELKSLCRLAGITTQIEINTYSGAKRTTQVVEKWTQITMHTARRTFVSLALANGLDAETIRRWTGHKDLRSFSAYVSIEQDRLKAQMEKAFGAPDSLKKIGA